MDEHGIAGIWLYYTLQSTDSLINVPQSNKMRVTPYSTAYFVAGQCAPGPFKKQTEHFELAGTQLDRLSVTR
jgi:hypothetical protein